MAKPHERIFALMGALVFLMTSAGLTVAVVFQMIQDNHNKALSASQAKTQTSCQDTQTEPTLPVPDIYKPTGAVSALQTTDLTPGSGPASQKGDCLVVKYYGTLASNGTEFDENFTKPTAFAFVVGGGQVISGWDQGMIGLKAGGIRRLVIPSSLAYGSQSPGAGIPANADLVFMVKLLRIQKT